MYSFPDLEPVCCSMSSSNCCFLACISQEAGHVVWYSHLLKNFPQFVVIHTVKSFGIVNKAEVDVFLELSCFFMIQQMLAIWSLVPMQYCSLQHRTLLPSPVTSTVGHCFHFGFILSVVTSPLFSSSILGTYWPGKFIFQCHVFLPFHTIHGILKARIQKWFAVAFSSGPRFVSGLEKKLEK